jgi:hypothetical protein
MSKIFGRFKRRNYGRNTRKINFSFQQNYTLHVVSQLLVLSKSNHSRSKVMFLPVKWTVSQKKMVFEFLPGSYRPHGDGTDKERGEVCM